MKRLIIGFLLCIFLSGCAVQFVSKPSKKDIEKLVINAYELGYVCALKGIPIEWGRNKLEEILNDNQGD